MPRRNLAGNYWGESRRITLRLSPTELRALDELAAVWDCERSAALRRAVRERADAMCRQQRDDTLTELDSMTVAQLRALASRLNIPGRSRKTGPDLRAAIRVELQR